MTDAEEPRLIGLDWGTSSLRAYLLGGGGRVLQDRSLPLGIMRLPGNSAESPAGRDAAFESALDEACGDWIRNSPSAPVIACGMVGSAQGWREASYLTVPLNLELLGKSLTPIRTTQGKTLLIIPGLVQHADPVNVMRGEETQIAGALHSAGLSQSGKTLLIGLPGTHSKWVHIREGTIDHFETFMTGEVYAALCAHTILGRTMQTGAPPAPQAFDRGVQAAAVAADRAGVLSSIFSVRALGLTGGLSPAEQPDYLSGLLIGDEVAALLRLGESGPHPARNSRETILLIGEEALCVRYERALNLRGCPDVTIAASAAERGLWRVAVQSGLVSAPETESDPAPGSVARC